LRRFGLGIFAFGLANALNDRLNQNICSQPTFGALRIER
jgi:hypothetical protein